MIEQFIDFYKFIYNYYQNQTFTPVTRIVFSQDGQVVRKEQQ